MTLRLLILLVLIPLNLEASAASCEACSIVEKEGEAGLEKLKRLSKDKLSETDDSGATPFFWSVYHGEQKIRDFLLGTLKPAELGSAEMMTELFFRCASAPKCPKENFLILSKLGHKGSAQAPAAAVAGNEECSLPKLVVLREIRTPVLGKDKDGHNILHQIVDRSRLGRPILPRDCLVTAIGMLVKDHPELKAEKSNAGKTPLQIALSFQADEKAWGSGIKYQHLEVIARALK